MCSRKTVFSPGRRIVQPVTHLWQCIPSSVRRNILVILPLLAITVSAVLALLGNHQRANIQADIQRHFQMVRGFDEVVILMVNAETGIRGYLLTRHDEFLQPYAAASQKLPAAMSDLRALTEAELNDNPRHTKLRLVNQIQLLIDRQLSDLAWQLHHVTAPNTFDAEAYNQFASGKRTMDEIRDILHVMQNEEKLLLTKSIHEIDAIRQRDYLAILLALIISMGTRFIARYHVDKEADRFRLGREKEAAGTITP